jgi:hypothetical protein
VIEHVGVDAIFAELPPVEWLCEGLRLARGQGVTCFAGYGYSGKTIVAQSLALSIASGRDAFGTYACRRGRVLHLDYEQGSRVTRDRYQRLARGMGITLDDLGDRLRLATFPRVYLDSGDAADVFARTLEGFDYVIVDALRGAAPTLDENDSAIRCVIDLLARESERTGVLPQMLVHGRKPKEGEAKGSARFGIRGSSAIWDAFSNVFVLGASKNEPTRVEHEKDRVYGTPLADFGLRIEDIDGATGARWGLRIEHVDRAEFARAADEKNARVAAHRRNAQRDAMVAAARAMRLSPGIGSADLRANLAAALEGCSKDRAADAVAALGRAVRVESGQRGKQRHFLDLDALAPEVAELVKAP